MICVCAFFVFVFEFFFSSSIFNIFRGVSVDEKNYIYVADSGNNRIQIFNPDGTFLRCFGRWGQVRKRVGEKNIEYLITALHTL